MHCIVRASWLSIALLCAGVAGIARAEEAAYASRAESTSEDSAAIMQLTQDFRDAIANKNVKQLSTLLLNTEIPFFSPMPPEGIKMINDKYDVHFNGIAGGGYFQFTQFLRSTPKSVEEKFYNIKIVQDANAGWVSFDYEFLHDDKVENYGIEMWQVMKNADSQWKILSVVWSSHFQSR